MRTKNYEKFKFAKTNRPVIDSHVNTLVKSIEKYGYFNSKPITVNRRMQVSDGQHRLLACQRLGIPVLYEVDDISVDESMVALNTTSNLWQQKDFIRHYAAKGIPCYVDLYEFIKESKYNVSNCISIYGGAKTLKGKGLRNGDTFERSPHFYTTLEILNFFKGKIPFNIDNKFVVGVISWIEDESTKNNHIKRLKMNAFTLVKCATIEQYKAQFDKLSKKRRRKNQ